MTVSKAVELYIKANGETPDGERYLAKINKQGELNFPRWEYLFPAPTDDDLQDFSEIIATNHLHDYLESLRYEVEQGGVNVGGMTIPTRDRDKTLINGKVSGIILENRPDEETFNFVLNGQNIQITNAQAKGIGLALEQHVQKTIDVAGYIRSLIMAGELTTQEEVRAAYLAEFS